MTINGNQWDVRGMDLRSAADDDNLVCDNFNRGSIHEKQGRMLEKTLEALDEEGRVITIDDPRDSSSCAL
jgi:hypothetical protein